jgi:predicted AAA+ superfamily ATPase
MLIDNTSILKGIKETQNEDISRPTLVDYLDALSRLMVIESQSAWNTHIRLSASLRKSPKRHLADVSLAIAALGTNKEALLKDVKFAGFLFESLVIHDLRVYAQANDASVYYYRDSAGLEVDAIVLKYNGD